MVGNWFRGNTDSASNDFALGLMGQWTGSRLSRRNNCHSYRVATIVKELLSCTAWLLCLYSLLTSLKPHLPLHSVILVHQTQTLLQHLLLQQSQIIPPQSSAHKIPPPVVFGQNDLPIVKAAPEVGQLGIDQPPW
jgi:hypothetical protein